jgi:TRAP-type mannitol/chloroaromatic compound transport system permease small subunit
MPRPIVLFVRYVDATNRFIGRFAMYLIYVLGGILLASTVSRLVFGAPFNWALEMSQFVLSAYYLLGGAYAWQQGAHVRMDLLYQNFPVRRRLTTDVITVLFVIVYLIVLFAGGVSSTNYAIVYKQQNYSSWAPLLWPVKTFMTIGIFLMLLQTIATFFKDVAAARGKPIA